MFIDLGRVYLPLGGHEISRQFAAEKTFFSVR